MITLPDSATKLAEALVSVPGVIGVVLGGSRARGRERPESDVDFGLFYDSATFEWPIAADVMREHDDAKSPRGLAPPGAWGPWMNGGAWLRVGGVAVDVLLRDAGFVEGIANDARRGVFSSNYLPGFPHAFHSFVLLGEVFHNVPLTGDDARLRALRERVDPYPEELRQAIADRFLYEARFSALLLRKIEARDEAVHPAGLAHRCAMCMVQTLFALNRTYLVNEKGAVEVAAGFELAPESFSTRVSQAFGPIEAQRRREILSALVDDVESLVRATMPLVTTWDAASFPMV